MSKFETYIGFLDIDYRYLEIKGDVLKDHSVKEMAFKMGQALLNKFPPKEQYVYYSKIETGDFKPAIITDEKLSDEECRRRGIYLRDVRLTIELRIKDESR